MPNDQCQRDGCIQKGVLRTIVDKVKNCVWRYFLCDDCDRVLQDYEKFAIASSKGTRDS
jgi:hypothetical protein